MGKLIERFVNAERVEDLIAVFGSFDENIKHIEEALHVDIVNRGNDLKISGDAEAVDKAARTLDGLLSLAARGETIDEQRVRYLITLVQEGNDAMVSQMAKDALVQCVAKCMIKSGRIEVIYEERLLKLMEIFRKHVDALSSFCSDDEQLIKILPDSLKHLERKLNGIF